MRKKNHDDPGRLRSFLCGHGSSAQDVVLDSAETIEPGSLELGVYRTVLLARAGAIRVGMSREGFRL